MSAILVPEIVVPPPSVYPMLLTAGKASMVERDALRSIRTPDGTHSHKPIPHIDVVEALIETLGFRKITVVEDRYALSPDGNRLFGTMMLDLADKGVRVCLGLRNSHDKRFSLSVCVGYRVMVCANLAFHGEFQPLVRKHTRNCDVRDLMALAVEQSQRSFTPMLRSIDAQRARLLTDDQARLVIYQAFLERAGIELPRHLGPLVHEHFFHPKFQEFEPRTLWSLQNAFTAAIGSLEPVPMMQATASLGKFWSQFS